MKADFPKTRRDEAWMLRELCNGCGPQNMAWARLFIPQFVFSDAGDRHDWDYWVGGGYEDYARANLRFYALCLMAIAEKSPLWKWPWHICMAHVYYMLVKLGGSASFHWGEPRTQEELEQIAAKRICADVIEENYR